MRRRVPLVLAIAALAASAAVGVAAAAPPDPATDRIGWEDGYWHNETIAVSDESGDRELKAVARRSMARVEVIRGAEFEADVRVSVVDRSTLDDGDGGNGSVAPGNATNGSEWNNQVWEALLIVGEDRDISELLRSTTRGAIGGYYEHAGGTAGDDDGEDDGAASEPRAGGVTIVTDGDGAIDEATVIHELVHALQDQRFNLSDERFDPPVQDEQLATRGILEGEANYVQRRFAARCDRDWQCVERGTAGVGGAGGGSRPENMGVFITMFQPYSDGPPYVHDLVERGGWDLVDERFADPPETSEAVIHRREDDAASIGYVDRSSADWRLFEDQGIDGYDVAGEASIFATFWYQSHPRFGAGLDVIDTSEFQSPDAGRYDTYDYTSPPSTGWAADRIYPYRNGDRRGYVWVTAWETREDAREFHEAHLAVLEGHGAERVDDATWRVPDGRFADAFRVTRHGRNVTVVNAPTVEELDEIRPRRADGGTGDPDAGSREEGGRSLPGPGAVAAAIAVLAGSAVARHRG